MRASWLLAISLFAALSPAAEYRGTVVDPSGAPVAGAEIAAAIPAGIASTATSGPAGTFRLQYPDLAGVRFIITAPGFETETISSQDAVVRLRIAPRADSVHVIGTAIDAPLSEQGGTAAVISGQEIRVRNEPFAADLLRYLPGIAVAQAGGRGTATAVFTRGGNANFTLVQIDGVPVNAFGVPGGFDFAHIPAETLERVEVIRGAQSAVYGSYANTGVINFVTRTPEGGPRFDVLAEGGSFHERRYGFGAAGTLVGFGLSGYAFRMDADGRVPNDDYRNEAIGLHALRQFGRQAIRFGGDFDSNEVGAPGPYGSNPAGLFTGIDRVSRNTNNFSDWSAHYLFDVTPRLRQEVIGSLFVNNSGYQSPFGFSYNKDLRGTAESRTVVNINRWYTFAAGAAWSREQARNTFITDANFREFPLSRDDTGLYWENRFQPNHRLAVNAGLRAEIIHTNAIPADPGAGRPRFAPDTIAQANPKIAVIFAAAPGTRLHSSFGTGIRPAAGLDIAFTNNPRLKPERTLSFDAGVERRIGSASLDATYFYNRFKDLIVSLGGSLSHLSSFTSDNLANSRAQGIEFTARLNPARSVSVMGSYTWLRTVILSLNGASGVAPRYFAVGQQLIRRPEHSGTVVSMFQIGRRVTANVTGYFRGAALDVEPNFGAFAGLYRNAGFANVGVNLNFHAGRGVTLYGNLRNALNQRYEEIFGYPALPLNFVSGIKWSR